MLLCSQSQCWESLWFDAFCEFFVSSILREFLWFLFFFLAVDLVIDEY